MAKAVVLGARDGDVICEHCVVADTAPRRLRGLLGRKHLDPGEGLLLRPAPSIHTFFMRFAIDAVFLDSDLVVLKVTRDLRPWRMAGCRKAKAVLELAAGETVRRPIDAGDRLEVLGVPA